MWREPVSGPLHFSATAAANPLEKAASNYLSIQRPSRLPAPPWGNSSQPLALEKHLSAQGPLSCSHLWGRTQSQYNPAASPPRQRGERAGQLSCRVSDGGRGLFSGLGSSCWPLENSHYLWGPLLHSLASFPSSQYSPDTGAGAAPFGEGRKAGPPLPSLYHTTGSSPS